MVKIAPSGFFDGKKMRCHSSIYVKKGLSDVFFWFEGKFIAFEVKTPLEIKFILKHQREIYNTNRNMLSKKKAHLKDQMDFIESIRKSGFFGYFVSSVDEVKNILREINEKGE